MSGDAYDGKKVEVWYGIMVPDGTVHRIDIPSNWVDPEAQRQPTFQAAACGRGPRNGWFAVWRTTNLSLPNNPPCAKCSKIEARRGTE